MTSCHVNQHDHCVVQISDCHLLANEGERLGDWDNWAAFAQILEHVRATHPRLDALLLTGDLVHDESRAGYARLAAWVNTLATPVYACAGNHDDPMCMAQAMPKVQVGGQARIGGWQLQLLNSRVPGHDHGELGATQLQGLAAHLNSERQRPTLLAVHHPAVCFGSAWLDKIAMRDGDALLRTLKHAPQVKAIVCGHVHQAREISLDSAKLLSCPAVTRQFLPYSQHFAEDNQHTPGYRCLHLAPDGSLRSHVHRVPKARQAGFFPP